MKRETSRSGIHAYAMVEDMLYSRPVLPYEIKNLEIEIQIVELDEDQDTERKVADLKKKILERELLINKIDNALELVKVVNEEDELLLRERYLKKQGFKHIVDSIPLDENSLMRRRQGIIKRLIPIFLNE